VQRKKLAASLTVVVNALDDPVRLLPALAALGKRHTNYGVEHRHFDSVGSRVRAGRVGHASSAHAKSCGVGRA
jgi:hemoglobin-like flavoprotein